MSDHNNQKINDNNFNENINEDFFLNRINDDNTNDDDIDRIKNKLNTIITNNGEGYDDDDGLVFNSVKKIGYNKNDNSKVNVKGKNNRKTQIKSTDAQKSQINSVVDNSNYS